MKFVLAALVAAFLLAAPASASAEWYWSAERAERALEVFEPGFDYSRHGADCIGYGRKWHGMWHKFYCDGWDEFGDYSGSGRLWVKGSGLTKFVWRWD